MSQLATDLAAQIAAAKAYTAGTGPAPAPAACATTRTYIRVIAVEYTMTEASPRPAGTNLYEELGLATDDDVIAGERQGLVSDFFRDTEYTLINDVITRTA